LKILFILNSFYPSIGGVEKVTENYCNELIKMGHEIYLISFRRGQISSMNLNTTPDFEVYNGINLYRVSDRFYGIFMFFKMIKIYKKVKFDLIQFSDFWGVFAIFFKLKYNIPIVHHLHGYQEICPTGLYLCGNSHKYSIKQCHSYCSQGLLKILRERFIYKSIWKFTDLIVAVSDAVKFAYIKTKFSLKKKILTIYNGISLDENGASSSTKNLYQIDNSNEKKDRVLLFVGRLIDHRNIIKIIRILPELIEKISNLKLIITGSGPKALLLKSEVEKNGLNKNVVFTGILTGDKLANMYLNADLLVMPITFPEPLSTVIIEAMSKGCPVITFNIGGMPEIIDNEKDGFLIPPYDWELFKEKIIKILTDNKKLIKIKQNAKKKVELKFNIRNQARKINKIYLKLMGRK